MLREIEKVQKLLKIPILYPLLIIAAAVALRVTLSIQGWTSTNSDESMWNLMALHIAYRGEHPTFFYGQHYLGVFEAYVGAVLFRIFKPSVCDGILVALPVPASL